MASADEEKSALRERAVKLFLRTEHMAEMGRNGAESSQNSGSNDREGSFMGIASMSAEKRKEIPRKGGQH